MTDEELWQKLVLMHQASLRELLVSRQPYLTVAALQDPKE